MPKTEHIPKRINVCGTYYTIRFDPEACADMYGFVRDADCLICYGAQDAQQLRNTLWHEALHAIDHSLKLGLSEKQVHALATSTLDFMRRNRSFTRFILTDKQ